MYQHVHTLKKSRSNKFMSNSLPREFENIDARAL